MRLLNLSRSHTVELTNTFNCDAIFLGSKGYLYSAEDTIYQVYLFYKLLHKMSQGPFSGSEINISASAAVHLNLILKSADLYNTEVNTTQPEWVQSLWWCEDCTRQYTGKIEFILHQRPKRIQRNCFLYPMQTVVLALLSFLLIIYLTPYVDLNLSSSEHLASSCKDAVPACQKDEVVGQGYPFCWTFMQKEAQNWWVWRKQKRLTFQFKKREVLKEGRAPELLKRTWWWTDMLTV